MSPTLSQSPEPIRPTFVGIAVAKAWLEVAARPSGEHWRVTNTEADLPALVERMRLLGAALIVLEATGGYERPMVAALGVAGLPVVVANPRQVRDFATATGRLAKTDVLDAPVLAHFAEGVRPAPRPLSDAATQELVALLERRAQGVEQVVERVVERVVEMLTAEKTRRRQAGARVRPLIEAHLAWLEAWLEAARE